MDDDLFKFIERFITVAEEVGATMDDLTMVGMKPEKIDLMKASMRKRLNLDPDRPEDTVVFLRTVLENFRKYVEADESDRGQVVSLTRPTKPRSSKDRGEPQPE